VLTADNTTRGGTVRCEIPGATEKSLFSPATWTAISTDTSNLPSIDTNGDAIGSDKSPEPMEELDVKQTESKIRNDILNQDLSVDSVYVGTSEVVVYYNNDHYWVEANAVGRIARVLMKDAPPNIEKFRIVSLVDDIPVQEYHILRATMERLSTQNGTPAETSQAITANEVPLANPLLDAQSSALFPKFSWAIEPVISEGFFDPDKPLQIGVAAGLSGSVEVFRGLSFNAELDVNIWNDFVTSTFDDSVLPHVRTDYEEYVKHGENGIDNLYGVYRFRLAPNVLALVKGGYLESMFGGAGGEIFWRPEHSRLSFGIDAYEVWQRNFDRRFGFQQYHVFTGHVAVYYESPWYGLNFRVLAGQYLAGDRGLTVEATRQFSTGVEIGAFFTKTNVSAQQFGEGSFDKGIIIRIPLEWALPVSTQTELAFDLRPITRDGGQRLDGDTTLYDDTHRDSYGEFESHIDDVMAQ
jgi:hypothetical protein